MNIPIQNIYIMLIYSWQKHNEKEINKAHKKILSKVHPDISPETARLASIVNEARDTILKNL